MLTRTHKLTNVKVNVLSFFKFSSILEHKMENALYVKKTHLVYRHGWLVGVAVLAVRPVGGLIGRILLSGQSSRNSRLFIEGNTDA